MQGSIILERLILKRLAFSTTATAFSGPVDLLSPAKLQIAGQ